MMICNSRIKVNKKEHLKGVRKVFCISEKCKLYANNFRGVYYEERNYF